MTAIEKIRTKIERLKWEIDISPIPVSMVDLKLQLEDLLSFLDTIEEEPNEDLEKAAESYEEERLSDYGYRGEWSGAFIAGANWQKEKDTRDMVMSDNRQFQKVYELGKKDMMEKMMKEKINEIIEYINGKEEN